MRLLLNIDVCFLFGFGSVGIVRMDAAWLILDIGSPSHCYGRGVQRKILVPSE